MPLPRRTLQRSTLLAACALFIGSCQDPAASDIYPVDQLTIDPEAVSIGAGLTATLSAHAYDNTGREIGVAGIFWASENTAVATVNQAGVVTGVAPGTVQIAASLGGRSGIATVSVTPRAVTLVRLRPPDASLGVGKTLQLVAEPLDDGGHVLVGRSVAWSSAATSVATVNGSGLVTGVSAGAAIIHATVDGIDGTAVITVVLTPVAQVHVTPPTTSLNQGDFVQLFATTLDVDGNPLSGRPVTWTSSNQAVAVVSSTGRVQSVTPGTVTITATSEGVKGTATITVTQVPVASVTISPSNPSVVVGGSVSLDAAARDAGGNVLNGRTATWSSNKTSVATVNSSGTVTGVSTGTATITATVDGVSGTTVVTVAAIPVASVQVSPPTPAITVGQTIQLTATARDAQNQILSGRPASWSSNNTAVATVNSSGLVTGVSVGAATISATVDGVVGTATVTVSAVPIASIVLTPNPASLEERTTLQLNAVARDAGGNVLTGRTIVWSSANSAVAGVSQTGLVTGIVPGSTSITASAPGAGTGGSTPSATVTVTVTYAPVASVQVLPPNASVSIGSSMTFAASLFDGNGQQLSSAGRTITWSSLNTNIATVNAGSGTATGVATGTATIRASATSPGQSSPALGTATLTVAAVPVASVTVSPAPATVHVGSTYASQFTATLRDAQGNVLTGRSIVWTSSNQGAATVDASTGVVTGVAPGSTTISATSGGVSGTSAVTVDYVPVSTVVVSPNTASLAPAATVQLSATPLDSANNTISGAALGGQGTTWSTSDGSVATVSSTGLVTAVAGGTATITAAIGSGSGTASITVLAPVASVTTVIIPDSVLIGQSVSGTATVKDAASNTLPGRTVTISSSSTSIATVSPSTGTSDNVGQVAFTVTGVAKGTATITASSNGKNGTKTVKVLVPVAFVTLSTTQTSVSVGSSRNVTATVTDANHLPIAGRVCSMASDNPSSATVTSSTGTTGGTGQFTVRINGIAKGSANITVTCETVTATVAVTVT